LWVDTETEIAFECREKLRIVLLRAALDVVAAANAEFAVVE